MTTLHTTGTQLTDRARTAQTARAARGAGRRSPGAVVVAVLAAAALVGCTAQAAPKADAKPSASASSSPSESPTPSSPADSPSATPTTAGPAAQAIMSQGSTGETVRELQARLGQLGFFSRNPSGYYGTVTVNGVQDFQERHDLQVTGNVSQADWDKLRGMTKQPTRDQLHPPTTNPVGRFDPRCMTGRVLCISKTTRTLSWMIDGHVQASMDVRFGSQYTPTREGQFKVDFKSRDHVSTIYHTAMPYAMFFSGGQAVHYSADFAARGYAGASHGCVNVRDRAKIAALFDQVRVGDKVVVYW